jgi:hypothetical protein
MIFTKKNKSINKGKFKTVIPNYMDSFSNKYPNYYLQSSLNEDIFLLKRKLKGYSKIHSHSSNNANKNVEINKNMNNKMPIISYINSISPINNYLMKKKKDSFNENIYANKSSKRHMMLTSINNSSIIYSAKEKGLSYSNNNASNYQSNINNNLNKKSLKNNENSFQNKNSIGNDVYAQKHSNNINNNHINNNSNINNNQCDHLIKKKIKDKKYSITSVNSRKNSIDKDKEQKEIAKKINKLNFNGLFNHNNNYNNKRIGYSSKMSTIIAIVTTIVI